MNTILFKPVRYDFGDIWLAEAWVKLSSQLILMTDDQCKNAVTTTLSVKGVDTR